MFYDTERISMTLDERLVKVLPTERQVKFQELEFYSFVHFSMNTFTDSEWGNGKEDPQLFNPIKFDALQWAAAIESAGMKGLILTCKHHDGFCLWPSKYTEHSVKSSPYKGGKGDIVREVADACKKYNLKFGVYLSPWDMNNSSYGYGEKYDDYFVNQLTELLTQYGEVFSVWFDGACGEGENGKKQFYDWDRYYSVIRELQPNACINVCGPDIRWCGNEAGHTRPSEWNVVPKRTMDTEKIAESSQQQDNEEFRNRQVHAWDSDLGSREILANEDELTWYPAEVNTSIRPGWFYHKYEDDKVRPLDELINIYNNSVGGNATFLLNIPPTPDGLFHENDVKRLSEIGEYLRNTYKTNLLQSAKLSADSVENGYEVDNVRNDDYSAYYRPQGSKNKVSITAQWDNAVRINSIIIKENILLSQRVERFTITDEDDKVLYEGTVIGHKRIVNIPNTKTKRITLNINDSRVFPAISFLGIYGTAD